MAYHLGLDGGNSKTHALIVDQNGCPLGFGESGGSDYLECGIERARLEWEKALRQALETAGIAKSDLLSGCFCLAGADLPEDYELLSREVSALLDPARTVVKNDAIAALRAGLGEYPYGITVVVGAGFNAAGRGKDGNEIVLIGAGYISGDYGGGRWLARQVVRAIMRAWDGRGPQTALTRPVLETFDVEDELGLVRLFRTDPGIYDRMLDLVPVLFETAYEGDDVAQSLLTMMGGEVGITANVLIRNLELEKEEFPVVLSTGVFRGKGPLFIDIITATVHKVAPRARLVLPDFIPVVGAVLEGLDEAGVAVTKDTIDHLRSGLPQVLNRRAQSKRS